MEATVFLKPNLKMTLHHHLCHIMFARNKSLNPAHTQGEGIMQKGENQEARIIGAILDAAYYALFFILFCFIICFGALELMSFPPKSPKLLCYLK